MRRFNVTGTCISDEDYMVDITSKLKQIKAMVDDKAYFTINRGRQYGKSTTLFHLRYFLANEYTVIHLKFEGLGQATFSNEEKFCRAFLEMIEEALEATGHPESEQEKWINKSVDDFRSLGRHIRKVCKSTDIKYVLMIDEVDKASNHLVFLDFLGKLRDKFLGRREGTDFTFHSVILAGVYDIKNIKLKMIREGVYVPTNAETSFYNSPWNIATSFNVDMSFSAEEIETMLNEYEADHKTEMDIASTAMAIYKYTGGYPVLVSSICKYIDENLEKNWSLSGINQAINLVLKEDSPLFDSLKKNLSSNKELSEMIYDILMRGNRWPFTFDNLLVGLGIRYGYFKEAGRRVAISNPIFEMRMTNYFVSKDMQKKISADIDFDDHVGIVVNDIFNMQVCLEKFAKYYHEHYSEKDAEFLHDEARYLLLFFLNSILNGKGFVHNEDQLRDGRRMDLAVNYLKQQFIIELKIWRGQKRHHDGYEQLLGYMDKKGLNEGYMLTFDFNQKKQIGKGWIDIDDVRRIFDIRV